MSKIVKISAAMMVKNEEEMLPGCLDSIKDFVDEIVIVDTGSEDNTVQIAESYGAKIYHHPWEADFSKHRNQSLAYSNGDWILIIDADERLQDLNSSPFEIKQKLSKLDDDVHAVLFTIKDFTRDGRKLKLTWKVSRLFKNGVGFHYDGSVHNQPIVNGKMADSDLVVKHYGYDLTPDKMEKKFERSNSLLQNRINNNPKDYEAYFYLANMYSAKSFYKEAANYGRKCLEHLPDSGKKRSVYLKTHYNIGACYLGMNKFELAETWFKKGLEYLPNDIDLHFGLVLLGAQLNDQNMIIQYSKEFLDNVDNFINNPEIAGNRFMYHLDEDYKKIVAMNHVKALIQITSDKNIDNFILKYEALLSKTEEAFELLKIFGEKNDISRLFRYTIKFSRKNNFEILLFKPLFKLLHDEIISIKKLQNELENLLKDETDYIIVTKLINLAIQEDCISIALDMLEYFETRGIPQTFRIASESLIKFYNGSKNGITEDVKELINNHYIDLDYYLTLIPYLYYLEEISVLKNAFELILPEYDKFEEIPEILLLPLSKIFLEYDDIEFFLQIMQALSERYEGLKDYSLEAVSDVGRFFFKLSDIYYNANRTQLVDFALDIAYSFTGDPIYVERRGNNAFLQGNYQRSLNFYTEALNKSYKNPEMIKNMGFIFKKSGDLSGKEQCDLILENI